MEIIASILIGCIAASPFAYFAWKGIRSTQLKNYVEVDQIVETPKVSKDPGFRIV